MKEIKKFRVITFGCRTNQAESRMMGESLTALGLQDYRITENSQNVDLVIINTCCVTSKAEKEVRQKIRKVKKENPKCFLVVTGCWAKKLKTKNEKLPARNAFSIANAGGKTTAKNSKLFKLIDLIITNEEKDKIADKRKKIIKSPTNVQLERKYYQDKYAKYKKAMVKVQEGCNNFCTYCIVPYVRGKSKSRPADKIIKEINKLVKQEIEEVVLTGVDIASYKLKAENEKLPARNAFSIANAGGKTTAKNLKLNSLKKGNNDLVKLILLILAETKVKKISFGSLGLGVFDDEFMSLYKNEKAPGIRKPASSKRLSSHFHIPLQSGCDVILQRMKRNYKISNFKFLISKLKREIPEFTFSTDILVGFPGETEEEFRHTVKFIKELKKILGKRFTKAHIFRFSPKKGTIAEKMQTKWGKVKENVKKERAQIIYNLLS